MKYIIIAIITIFLSAFCIANAMAQGVVSFGPNRAQDSAKTKGQIVAPVYATSDTNKVLGITSTGHLVWRTKSGISPLDTTGFLKKTDTSRSGIVTTYFYVDSLYSSIGTHDSLVKYSDSNIVYATQYGVDTTKANLRAADALKVNYTDTASLIPTKAFLLLNYWRAGGNSFGVNSTVGTNDAFAFDIETNGTTRARWHSGGGVTFGGTTNSSYLGIDVSGISRFTAAVTNRAAVRIHNATTDPPFVLQTYPTQAQFQTNLEWTGSAYQYITTNPGSIIRTLVNGNIIFSLVASAAANATVASVPDIAAINQDSTVDAYHTLSVGHSTASGTFTPIYFQRFTGAFSVITSNTHFRGTGYNYKLSTYATRYDVNQGGDHVWYTAPSGTAGNAVTFGERMRLKNGGNFLLGSSTDRATGVLQITGNISVLGTNSSNTIRWDNLTTPPVDTVNSAGWILINGAGGAYKVKAYQ